MTFWQFISRIIRLSPIRMSADTVCRTDRLPRMRRFCLMLSYCGKQYSGMQRNPGASTIEECLLKALRDSNFIPEEHYVRPQLMYFQRAARTDKHVSAIRQTVSLKIRENIKDNLDTVNKHLPSDIRLMAAKRVTASFDAKNHCDARTYSYLMPTLALCPITEVTQESYRAPPEIIELFNETLKGYGGSHIFHNFTNGKKFTDDSATRCIKYMNCSEPFFPCNQDGLEFVVVRVKGQSFMMHQIRKMIGLAIAVVKGFATKDHIRKSMEETYMDIPKAPGLGLMLEEVHFNRYNNKFGGDGHHEPLEWNAQSELIEKFKDEQIYPIIVETEIKEKSMLNWLQTLSLHTYGSDTICLPRDFKQSVDIIPKSHNTHHESATNESEDDANDEGQAKKRIKVDVKDTSSPHPANVKVESTIDLAEAGNDGQFSDKLGCKEEKIANSTADVDCSKEFEAAHIKFEPGSTGTIPASIDSDNIREAMADQVNIKMEIREATADQVNIKMETREQ